MAGTYADHPPPGWHILDVMRESDHKPGWAALLIDVPYEDFSAWKDAGRPVHECWFRIPGKHPSREAAWEALEDLMETRH
jgi:hypothetical protein